MERAAGSCGRCSSGRRPSDSASRKGSCCSLGKAKAELCYQRRRWRPLSSGMPPVPGSAVLRCSGRHHKPAEEVPLQAQVSRPLNTRRELGLEELARSPALPARLPVPATLGSVANGQSKPGHVYSKVSPIALCGACSQGSLQPD